ncbi:hypothetical protein F511_07281 [Dorcoceras hygrometricum]|uniref:Uncharacterized protein n=1 Tax=Dorcoceras hygrometricum TaxID=472368 RepID=A0A2Z7B1K7_9LAMI|nr:hypothetical protein F511_07281 [Dorcoceras hygrometricum]
MHTQVDTSMNFTAIKQRTSDNLIRRNPHPSTTCIASSIRPTRQRRSIKHPYAQFEAQFRTHESSSHNNVVPHQQILHDHKHLAIQ